VSESPADRFRRIDAVFDAVLDLPEHEQIPYIDRACGTDGETRAEVLRMLEAYQRSGNFLESPAVEIGAPLLADARDVDGAVPNRIGAFRIVREIGHGGMGDVFLAERADGQFEQRVAIKLIRRGAVGLVPRFLEERRILARLEHPGIARLLDGGITPDGLPYFVMELVEGEPIDRYCETKELSLERRLELFETVCDIVGHAHQHLVIHRDLKPSNVLVTADGQVKLLDFGIAKLLDAQDAGIDATRPEFKMMTPEFAAPEQVRGAAVSTATDVYSLGVVLYLLLTGERPYDVRGKSPAEIERLVCTFDPARPSTRAGAGWRRRLRGDLDLIVMTALQKEEARRYQSPAALAQDMRRFRAGHPIVARPDSASYRVKKFVGRHRVGVAVASLLLLGLAGAASRERVLRNRAEVEARKATEVEEFLVRVFDVADPFAREQRDGGTVSARELLDRGASRIDSTLVDQPEVQAELRSVFGRVYANLGLFDQATPLLERALAQRRSVLGPLHASVASDMDLLGAALTNQNRFDEAERLLRDALDQRRRLLGNSSVETAGTLENLATLFEERGDFGAAEPLHREALAIRQSVLGDTAIEVANSLNNLGLILYRKGAYAEAEALYRQALDIDLRRLGENHPLTAAVMQNVGQVLQARRQLEDAEQYYRRSLAAKRVVLGDTHPSVTISLNNLGNLVARQLGRLDEGEALTREALALDRAIFGERHTYVAQGLANLGVILRMKGEFAEAERLLRQALDMNRALLGDTHQSVATNYNNIGLVRYQLGDLDGAVQLARVALAQYRQLLGEDHLNTLTATGNLARFLIEQGEAAEAEALSRAYLSKLDTTRQEHSIHFISAQRALGHSLVAQGRVDEALPLLGRALERARREWAERDWRLADVQLVYGNALAAKGRYADAEPLLRAAHATFQQRRTEHPRLAAQAEAAVRRLAGRQSR
jgi:serine/threonine-protein kinase